MSCNVLQICQLPGLWERLGLQIVRAQVCPRCQIVGALAAQVRPLWVRDVN